MLGREVVTLTDCRTQPLHAGIILDKSTGQCGGELIGVIDAIAADELILGENLREVEVRFRCGKFWKLALIPEWNVDVIQPRLEGLMKRSLLVVEFALEEHAAVDTEDRQAAIEPLLAGEVFR